MGGAWRVGHIGLINANGCGRGACGLSDLNGQNADENVGLPNALSDCGYDANAPSGRANANGCALRDCVRGANTLLRAGRDDDGCEKMGASPPPTPTATSAPRPPVLATVFG